MSEKKTIFLIRHGETEWNRLGKFRGRNELPLNENGMNSAHITGEELRDSHIEIFFTSPLKRAVQTAEIISEYIPNSKVVKDVGFQNINIGEWEGMTKAEVKIKYLKEYEMWFNEPENLIVPGGESIIDVQKRAFKRLQDLVQLNYHTMAIVSHRSVLKVLLANILGMKEKNYFWRISIGTAKALEVEYSLESGFILKI